MLLLLRCAPRRPAGTCSDVGSSPDIEPGLVLVLAVVVAILACALVVHMLLRRRRH